MSNQQNDRRFLLRNVLCLALGVTLFPCATYGQVTQNQSDEVAGSIAKVKSGDFNGYHVEVIAKAGAVQAVPALEEQFVRTTDLATKAKIAGGLVRLGDKDSTYWNFLLLQAALVVDSDIPDAFDSQGKVMDHQFSPELKAWAVANNVDVNTAGVDSVYDFPGKVLLLGETGDPRGVPLLRRALQSRDGLIVAAAAKGLAQVQDKDSIPLLIAAARSAHAGIASEIAKALIYFDDPDAQSAVDRYMSKEHAKIFRDARAHGMKPFGN